MISNKLMFHKTLFYLFIYPLVGRCSDGMVTIRKYRANGDDKSNDNANWGFGPSSNVGKFKRHAGFEISRNYPLGMYNAYAVGAEIVSYIYDSLMFENLVKILSVWLALDKLWVVIFYVLGCGSSTFP